MSQEIEKKIDDLKASVDTLVDTMGVIAQSLTMFIKLYRVKAEPAQPEQEPKDASQIPNT